VGQSFTVGVITWQWTGSYWLSITSGINLDGGKANSNYGGISSIDGGSAGSF
jgi:hypothetical protein